MEELLEALAAKAAELEAVASLDEVRFEVTTADIRAVGNIDGRLVDFRLHPHVMSWSHVQLETQLNTVIGVLREQAEEEEFDPPGRLA